MVHFIYKDDSEKYTVRDLIESINAYIYKTVNTEKIDYNVDYIKDSLLGVELLKKVNNSNTNPYDDGEDLYFKTYGMDPEEFDKVVKRFVFETVIHYSTGGDEALYFPIFFDKVYNDLFDKYTTKPREKSILDDIGNFGLIAFSTHYNIHDGNNLEEAALDDREFIRDLFDHVMGDGSFNEINVYAERINLDYRLNKHNVSSFEFNSIMNALRTYFYKYMEDNDIISEEEKEKMITRFEDEYARLIELQKEHQKSRH
ncbi:MAG: hypothetical protein IKZ96_02850 [Bacilli bacterium]|nr:hypothetical protein [Bacilli bacterium]